MVINAQHIERRRHFRTLDKPPVVTVVTKEFVCGLQLERVARQFTDLFVPATEVRCLRTREQVAVEMSARLVVIAELACEREIFPRVYIAERYRVTGYVPGVREETILTFDCRSVRQEISKPQADRVTGPRIRVKLRFKAEADGAARIEIAYGAVRIIEKALFRNRLDVKR